ncbi:MAG: hypothetical protein AUJ49_07810 [Desulfovibrionaceae bacterium CG1_02_65_16]|nr:MAG: hypothetical protein AUJ49_07810 [Desulfovibrionaceae bacterium CG1_02_65_16]
MEEQPYLGEISVFAFTNIPRGWAPCNGQALSKSEYPELANLLGGTFGSTATTFNLPDLRGRVSLGVEAQTEPMGRSGGEESVNPPSCVRTHTHGFCASESKATQTELSDHMLCAMPTTETDQKLLYSPTPPSKTNPSSLNANSVVPTGGSKPHDNMQPSLVLNFCIALTGIYPQNA